MAFRLMIKFYSDVQICIAAFNSVALLLRPPACSEIPALSPECNMAAYLDAWLLGRDHLYPYPSCRRADPPCAYLDPEV